MVLNQTGAFKEECKGSIRQSNDSEKKSFSDQCKSDERENGKIRKNGRTPRACLENPFAHGNLTVSWMNGGQNTAPQLTPILTPEQDDLDGEKEEHLSDFSRPKPGNYNLCANSWGGHGIYLDQFGLPQDIYNGPRHYIWYYGKLPAKHTEHTLKITWTPSRSPTADTTVELFDVSLRVKDTFADCQDSKACLSFLGDGSSEQTSLRNNNTLQYICLLNESPYAASSVCSNWRGCLKAAGTLEVIQAYLKAISPASIRQKLQTCEDDNEGLKANSGGNVPSCMKAAHFCSDQTHGSAMHKYCPKTCGVCTLAPAALGLKQVNMELDDKVAVTTAIRQGGWTLTPTAEKMTHTPTQDQSCFTDPESFDCLCHTAMQRRCRKEEMRKQMVHPNGRIYTLTQCVHFFVCTHSSTCKSYKDTHCKSELALQALYQKEVD